MASQLQLAAQAGEKILQIRCGLLNTISLIAVGSKISLQDYIIVLIIVYEYPARICVPYRFRPLDES